MQPPKDLFTVNKQKVREMDTLLINRYLINRKGDLRYLGLPASTLTDLIIWNEYFSHYSAVERGRDEAPFIYQHNLMLTAMKYHLTSKLHLYRGDIDDVLLNGEDEFNSPLKYPFDVVSLDYSGGLIYKEEGGIAKRPDSIRALFTAQAERNADFLLLISFNTDNQDQGEIRKVISNLGRDLSKLGLNVAPVIQAYLDHELEEARLKIYAPYLIKQLATPLYQCEFAKPIFYLGNRNVRMMHFATWMKRTQEYVAGQPSRQTDVLILNLKVFQCSDGELTETDFNIPSYEV